MIDRHSTNQCAYFMDYILCIADSLAAGPMSGQVSYSCHLINSLLSLCFRINYFHAESVGGNI